LTPFRDFERRAREPRRVRDKTTVTANFLIDNLKYMVPIDGEVRKGSFGFFAHTLFFKIEGNRDVGKRSGHELKFDDHGFIIDTGLSYELGTWALGEGLLAPRLTLEPFVAARLIHDPVDLNLDPSRHGTKTVRFSSYVPIVGLRTFWDFGEHWNLQIDGDWGGWDIDDNHKTYQLLGLLGYRFQAGGLSWNVQAGYRYFQLWDLRRAARVKLQARGPQLSIGLDF
jgi:hypothetical protein